MRRSRLVAPLVRLLAAILLSLGSTAFAQFGERCPPDIITESRAGVARARSVLPSGASVQEEKHEKACRNTSSWLHMVLTAEALGSDPPQWEPQGGEGPSQPKGRHLTPYLTSSGGERVYATWETEELRYCCAASVAHLAITVTPKVTPPNRPATQQEVIAAAKALTGRLLACGDLLVSHADLQETSTMHYQFVFPSDEEPSPATEKALENFLWLRNVEVVTDSTAVTFILNKRFSMYPYIPTEADPWFEELEPMESAPIHMSDRTLNLVGTPPPLPPQ